MTDESAHEQHKWIDPDPRAYGVLLSDRIEFYVEKIRLIDPSDFQKESLGPASYNLHVGDVFYLNDVRKEPDADGKIVIPRNALIYVKLKEKLNLPHYMIAQHDLKVKQEYRGFLAGRSTLIDPGYSGHINYPVFNFTDEDKAIYVGEELTIMCFVKTTPFGKKESLNQLESDAEVRQSRIEGIGGRECRTFRDCKDRSIPEYWYRGERHMLAVERIQRTLDRWRKIGIGAIIVAALTVVGPIVGHCWWVSDKLIDVHEEVNSLTARLDQASSARTGQPDSNARQRSTTVTPADGEDREPNEVGE